MYQLIRESRKSVTLKIDDEFNLIVKAPYYMNEKDIEQIIIKNKDWIDKTIAAKKNLKEKSDWLNNGKIYYLGEKKDICIIKEESGKNKVEYIDNTFYLYVNFADDDKVIRDLLESYFRKEAKKMLTYLTDKYCNLLGCNYCKITIRKQKTRWGSCSSKGNLSYNLKMMCAPIGCIEYVVLHEVMHLRHFNHSQAFWNDISAVMPDYNQKKIYLKKYGSYFEI